MSCECFLNPGLRPQNGREPGAPGELGGSSSRARRSLGSKQKALWRHGWKPRPPQKQPSFRSAWTGQRPVPTQPLETRPYTGKLAGERTSVRGQECCYVRKQGGTLRDFQGGVRWSHPKFRFHPKRVRCPGELSGNSLRARRSGGRQEALWRHG